MELTQLFGIFRFAKKYRKIGGLTSKSAEVTFFALTDDIGRFSFVMKFRASGNDCLNYQDSGTPPSACGFGCHSKIEYSSSHKARSKKPRSVSAIAIALRSGNSFRTEEMKSG